MTADTERPRTVPAGLRREALPPVDYEFTDGIAVTLPAHQWQLLLRASHDEMLDEANSHRYGLAQAHHEIASMYRIARARVARAPLKNDPISEPTEPEVPC